MRPVVLWFGDAPDGTAQLEFARRDLHVILADADADVDVERHARVARAAVFAATPGKDNEWATAMKRWASPLRDLGLALEGVVASDADLQRMVASKTWDGSLAGLVRLRVNPPWFRVAQDAARHDPGPTSRDDIQIRMANNRQPPVKRDKLLLGRAFDDCTTIDLTSLVGGRSAARVFLVHATLAGSLPGVRPQPLFAKIDDTAKIDREFANYRDYAERYIPFGLRPNARRIVSGDGRSVLVGDFVDRSESLWELVRRGVATSAISSLFHETLEGWTDQGYAQDPATGAVCLALERAGICRPRDVKLGYAEMSGCPDAPDEIWARLASLSDQRFRLAPAHGDLHGENVRVRNGQAILIDLASVASAAPTTTDIASLEVALAFDLPPSENADEYENTGWRAEVERLYAPAAFDHPPQPNGGPVQLHWMGAAVRQLRRFGIAAQSCPREYESVIATLLLRRCQWDDGCEADRFRRSIGYAIAGTLARDLDGRKA